MQMCSPLSPSWDSVNKVVEGYQHVDFMGSHCKENTLSCRTTRPSCTTDLQSFLFI